jgi:hypothetical protein
MHAQMTNIVQFSLGLLEATESLAPIGRDPQI